MSIGIITLIVLGLAYVIFLYRQYSPSIDLVAENNKYRVILWYNNIYWNNATMRYETQRTYKRLFTI